MWDKIKQHPWIVGGIVGVFLLVILLSSSSSSSSTTAATDTSTSSTGDQLQAYMASLNLQGQQIQAASTASAQQTAGAVTVAQLQANSTDLANTLAAQVAEYTTKAQADYATQHDTLAAGVATSQINAQVQEQQINANTQVQQAQIYQNVLSQVVGLQATQAYYNTALEMNALNNKH